MPVTMSFLSADEKLSKIFTPSTLIYGTASLNELPVYDSISGISMDEKQKSQMLKILSVMSQMRLPNRNLAVGQSDTINTPVNIPIAGLTMKMDYITTYLLKSIQGNTALFDIKSMFKLNMEMKDVPVDGSGSGEGTMEYNLKDRYPTQYDFNYNLNMRVAKEGLIMHVKMNENLINTCKIQAL
jgi:hypothetical protein